MKYVALKEVSNDILINGDECITTIDELFTALVDKETTEIELRKEFIDIFFTYDALCDFVSQASSIAPNVHITAPEVTVSSTSDIVDDLLYYRKPEEFIYAIEHSSSKVIATIHKLAKDYQDTHDEMAVTSNKLATMLVQIDDLRNSLIAKSQECEALQSAYNQATASLEALVARVNFKYEKTVNPDKMFLADSNQYKHVLYIKEITRIHYVDSLIYYVGEVLKTLYNAPVRSVVIEPYYAYGREVLYPDYTPHWKLSYRDVYSGNIMMAGYQPKLMTDILKNSNHLHYLIILDRGGYQVPHVTGGNVSVLYTASDVKDIPKSINPKDVITYNETTLNIPYIENFDTMSPEIKIQKYSSMPIVKGIINILEEVT